MSALPRRSDEVVITPALLRGAWPLPDDGGDKNANGRVLVVGGNVGMPGAVLLAAEAALRAGAGKLQVATVREVAPALGAALPEGYVAGLPANDEGDLALSAAPRVVGMAEQADVVVLGPGWMNADGAAEFLGEVVPHLSCHVVIDALGLAYLTGNLRGLGPSGARTVLSPNTDELAVTLGRELPEDLESDAGMNAVHDAAVALAQATGAVVVSGAAYSVIATPQGETWREESGRSGLAVSGSGDVKAGIIAGMMGRGFEPLAAAAWGKHVHGRCGERLAAELGPRGFLARDLLPVIPAVLAELSR